MVLYRNIAIVKSNIVPLSDKQRLWQSDCNAFHENVFHQYTTIEAKKNISLFVLLL